MNGNMNDESVEDILNTLNVHRERFTNEEVQQLRHLAAKVAYRAKPVEELTKDFRIRITEGACSSKGATREVALMKSTQDKYNASMIFHCLGKDNVELRGVCDNKWVMQQFSGYNGEHKDLEVVNKLWSRSKCYAIRRYR